MSLEKDIQQTKPFNSAIEKAIVNVMFTSNRVSDQQFRLLKQFDITVAQYNVLRILKGHSPKPITINGIIERMLDKMSNVSRLVDKLVQKEYVRRTYRKDDKRACDVHITSKGEVFLESANQKMAALHNNLKGISKNELDNLNQLLDKFRDLYKI